jgi:hypothetical protein
MRRFYLITFILSAFLLFSNLFQLLAQEQDNNPFPTPNTQIGAKPDPKKQGDKEKRFGISLPTIPKKHSLAISVLKKRSEKWAFNTLLCPKAATK